MNVTQRQFISHEIQRRKLKPEYRWMLTGVNYYEGKQDVLRKNRTAIGEGGEQTIISNLPNNRIIDNQYRKMVKQKVNYLVGKPFTVTSDDDEYTAKLRKVYNKDFMRKIKNLAYDSLNCGIGWLHPYYDEYGQFRIKKIRAYEVIPGWSDVDHTELDYVVRFYDIEWYDGINEKTITKVEYYTKGGVDYYEYQNGSLVATEPWHKDYLEVNGHGYNWQRIPFIPFKYNAEETPLIVNCKSLQDALNEITSNFTDNMQEDMRNTILVLVNYEGENLGEFRRNLAAYGAVKVESIDGVNGDVRALQIEVNAENYKTIIAILKRGIVEACMGYDSKDERMGGSPNQMNIQSMYNDIDLDASDMETEFQASFEQLRWFIDCHLENMGDGDHSDNEVDITFNTDMPMDESGKIDNITKSMGVVSQATLLANHPWVNDVDKEIEQLNDEQDDYENAFVVKEAYDNDNPGE